MALVRFRRRLHLPGFGSVQRLATLDVISCDINHLLYNPSARSFILITLFTDPSRVRLVEGTSEDRLSGASPHGQSSSSPCQMLAPAGCD